jgi:molybdopterin molybdotransferase
VILPDRITPGEHVTPQGSECQTGELVLKPGDTITPLAVAVIASLGRTNVLLRRRPSLAVITTGSELVPPGGQPGPGQIRDSNGPMLVSMARDMGIEDPAHLHVADSREEILHALAEVAEHDVVLLTGGVSMGNYDFVPETLDAYGAKLVFHKVAQKPGKPLLLAKKGPQLLFGLPGNPLACHLCFHRYVSAAIRVSEGKPPVAPSFSGQLEEPVRPRKVRTYFVPGWAERPAGAGEVWPVHPLPGVSSADVFTPCRANCYLEVPPGEEPVAAGQFLRLTWIGSAPWSN